MVKIWILHRKNSVQIISLNIAFWRASETIFLENIYEYLKRLLTSHWQFILWVKLNSKENVPEFTKLGGLRTAFLWEDIIKLKWLEDMEENMKSWKNYLFIHLLLKSCSSESNHATEKKKKVCKQNFHLYFSHVFFSHHDYVLASSIYFQHILF